MKLIDSDALGVGRCSKNILPAAYCAGWNGLIELIEKAPTIDAVPVVRCRECKKKNKKKCPMTIVNFGRNGKEVLVQNHVPDDFYCAAGERKEGAD